MKFTAKEDFKVGRTLFEQGNSYNSERHGLTDAQVETYWQRGWIEVDGWDPAPERQPGATRLQPAKTQHQ